MEGLNLVILVVSGLTVVAVFSSLVALKAGAPLLLTFLAIGVAAGMAGVDFAGLADPSSVFLLGSAALATILFDSGFQTRFSSYRNAAAPAIALSTAGVAVSAAVMALPAHWIFGFGWMESLLLGTVLSSTDAAAVFFLLRVGGITIRDRVRSMLEIESGTNDPVAVLFSVTLIGLIVDPGAGGADASTLGTVLAFLGELALQAGLGVVFGIGGGLVIIAVVNRVRMEHGLYPVLVIALALLFFALSNALGGSGFLTAYLAGLVAGNTTMNPSGAIRRFQDGLTWIAQIAMFVSLGLLARPAEFAAILGPGLVLAGVLIFVARPVAVYLCLTPFGYGWPERLFTAWVGLRGAVSILLALMPVVSGVPLGGTYFALSFVVVVTSLALQGWTVRPMARWLGLIVPETRGPVDRMEVDLPGIADRELIAYDLHADSPVARGKALPRWARPLLVRRNGRVKAAPRSFLAGDRVYLLAAPSQVPLLDTLFGRPIEARDKDVSLDGDFTVGADARLGMLCQTYGLPLEPKDTQISLADLFRREFRSDIEIGDRLHLGPVDLIVTGMNQGAIVEVGIALDPATTGQNGRNTPFDRFRRRFAKALEPR